MKILVGLCGQAGSGKDTAAQHLIENFSFCESAFAYPVKEFAHTMFEFPRDTLWGPSQLREQLDDTFLARSKWNLVEDNIASKGVYWLKSSLHLQFPDRALFSIYDWFKDFRAEWEGDPISPRMVLQSFGTAWGREFDEDIWINALFNDPLNSKYDKFVVTDLRFENEMKAIKSRGGKIIRIERPGFVEKAGKLGLGFHSSELEQGNVIGRYADSIILNEGSLDHFLQQVEEVVRVMFNNGI